MILGPPGCGKTHRLLQFFEEELREGVLPGHIAFMTFTRAARQEAQERVCREFGLKRDQMPWLSTIHSAAFRLLEASRRQILSDERWAEFAETHGYPLSHLPRGFSDPDDTPGPVPRRTQGDLARYVWAWGRSHGFDPETALGRCPVEGLRADFYRQFVRRLEHFKRLECLLDFSDLLEGVLEGGLRPDVDVAFIDEAQDLSPLQIRVCESWFAPCERFYVAGDDDQAIYTFQGADPSWLGGLASRGTPEVLGQSRRVPRAALRLAERIIGQNSARVQKRYEPTAEEGAVLNLDLGDALDLIEEHASTFVLARNRIYLGRVAGELIDRGVPYEVEGYGAASPLSGVRLRRALDAAEALMGGAVVTAKDLRAMLSLVREGQLVEQSAREQVEKLAELNRCLKPEALPILGLEPLRECVKKGGALAPLAAISPRIRKYIARLLEQNGGQLPDPRAVLTSIHGAKGREAELVIVLSDMTKTTFTGYGRRRLVSEYETENRIFYVAVTRAMKTLVLVRHRGRRHYVFPFIAGDGRASLESQGSAS